jgi:hypothetical protein
MAEQGANANAPPAEHARESAAASLRLPDFWPDAPEGWFVFIESKFRVKHVTDEAEMLDLVVGCLPRNIIRQVIDVLQRPDQEQPYTVLKRRLPLGYAEPPARVGRRYGSGGRRWYSGSSERR